MCLSKVNEQKVKIELDRNELCILQQALDLRRCVQIAGLNKDTYEGAHGKELSRTVKLRSKVLLNIRLMDVKHRKMETKRR